jgi:hypothetical protein
MVSRRKLEDNIKVFPKGIGYVGLVWIHLAQNSDTHDICNNPSGFI